MTSFDGLQGPLNPLTPERGGVQRPGLERTVLDRGAEDGPSKTDGFASQLVEALRDVDSLQDEAAQKAEALARGEDVPIHDLLIAQEKADVSFRLLVEVRNQLVDAWREVTRGPI